MIKVRLVWPDWCVYVDILVASETPSINDAKRRWRDINRKKIWIFGTKRVECNEKHKNRLIFQVSMWLHVCIVFGTGKNVAFVTKDPAYLNNKCFNFLFLLPLWHMCLVQAKKNYSKIRKQRKTIAEKCGVKLSVLNAKRDELLLKLPKTASQKVWSPHFSLNNMISLKWRKQTH